MSKQYEDSELQKDPPCSTSENNEENLTSEASENQKPEGVTRRKFVALAGTWYIAGCYNVGYERHHGIRA